MIIGLRDFGPIREFDVDLNKDFHLMIGRNSIGKSYAITAIYLILKNIVQIRQTRPFSFRGVIEDVLSENDTSIFNKSDDLRSFISNDELREISITNHIDNDLKNFLNKTFLRELTNSFINTFSSLTNIKNKFSTDSDSTYIILSIPHDVTVTCKVSDSGIYVDKIERRQVITLKKSKRARSNHYSSGFTIYTKEDIPAAQQIRRFRENYMSMFYAEQIVLLKYLSEGISGVHYLPASRSGLYQALSAFGQIIAELSRNRSFLSKKIEIPGISEPVSDYFIKLSDIRVTKKLFEERELNSIAKEIEDVILNGSVEFNSNTKQLMFSPLNTKLKLELSSTSSMVSELAPIVSYLRYVLTKSSSSTTKNQNDEGGKSLVMIEEPEAHLHPDVQIKLTEIFEKLVSADIKLIITTHSNFIFNKVNNLIIRTNATNSETGFSKNSVNSMVFKNTEYGSIALTLETDDFGMSDNNFSEPTEYLFEEQMNLFTEIENKSNSNDREAE